MAQPVLSAALKSVVVALCVALGTGPGCASLPAQTSAWRDTPVTRLEALALIQTLNAELLASTSATLTLEQWCHDHKLAEPALIVARRVNDSELPASAAQRNDLQVGVDETVRYRRVELRCGARVLSIAENWYVPSRLTPAMNQALDGTQAPFGKVVLPLHPHRATLAVQVLWSPLAVGWERERTAARVADRKRRALIVPDALFEHRAILYSEAHLPIAELHEVYQRGVLEFAEPVLH